MSGEQPDNQLPQSDDLTNVDLYCLHCGYNLRGLSGDPRRCPECGSMNPIGGSAAISELAAREQTAIDSLPAACLRDSLLFLLGLIPVVPLLWFKGDLLDPPPCHLACSPVLLLVFGPLWVRHLRHFGESCRYRRGWLSWLVKYHLTSLLLVVLVIGFAYLLVQPPTLVDSRWTANPWCYGLFWVMIIGALVFGVARCQKVYRRLLARRLQLQDGVALERARTRLRQRLTQERR